MLNFIIYFKFLVVMLLLLMLVKSKLMGVASLRYDVAFINLNIFGNFMVLSFIMYSLKQIFSHLNVIMLVVISFFNLVFWCLYLFPINFYFSFLFFTVYNMFFDFMCGIQNLVNKIYSILSIMQIRKFFFIILTKKFFKNVILLFFLAIIQNSFNFLITMTMLNVERFNFLIINSFGLLFQHCILGYFESYILFCVMPSFNCMFIILMGSNFFYMLPLVLIKFMFKLWKAVLHKGIVVFLSKMFNWLGIQFLVEQCVSFMLSKCLGNLISLFLPYVKLLASFLLIFLKKKFLSLQKELQIDSAHMTFINIK